MINGRISGSNALKLQNDYNRNTYITKTHKTVKRRHKWRLKENYRYFYIGATELLGITAITVAIPFLTVLFFS